MIRLNMQTVIFIVSFFFYTTSHGVVKNVYINGNGATDPAQDLEVLKDKVYEYSKLNSFEIDLVLNRKDKTLLGFVSILQNKTNLGEALRDIYPESYIADKPELYDQVSKLSTRINEAVDIGEIAHTFITKGTRLYALTKREDKVITYNLIKDALDDIDGHQDFIMGAGKFKDKGLNLTKGQYEQLKFVLKKINLVQKVTELVDDTVHFVGFLAGYEPPSNNQDFYDLKNYFTQNSSDKFNVIGHYDGAIIANNLLDVYGNFHNSRMMSVGTADSRVWGAGSNFTLLEDLAVNFVPYALDHTPGLTNHNNILSGIGGFTVANGIKYGFVLGHDFSGVYLTGLKSKTEIIDRYVRNFFALSGGVCTDCYLGSSIEANGEEIKAQFIESETSRYMSEKRAKHYDFSIDTCRVIQIHSQINNGDSALYLDAYQNDGKLAYVNYNDDFPPTKDSRIEMQLAKGTYQIEVVAKSAPTSDLFLLKVSDLGACPTPTPTPTPIVTNDYSTSNMRLSKSNIERGEEFSVYVTQSYFGTQTDSELSSSYVGYFCSKDTRWDSSDYFLDRDSSSLGSDDLSHNETERLTIPATECETGYILAVANYNDRIEESDKSNNVSYTPITILDDSVSQENDYSTSNIRLSKSTVDRGEEFSVYVTQSYSGSKTDRELSSSYVGYFCSKDTRWDSSDYLLDTDSSSLGSDDLSHNETEKLTIPASKCETGYILAVANYDDRIDEEDKSNNISYTPITINGGSNSGEQGDVYISRQTVSNSALKVGERYKMSARQYYKGNLTRSELGSIQMKYYLSNDHIYSRDDKYLCTDYSSIGSDDSYDTESCYWTPSSSDKGAKFIIFRVDSRNDVVESNEANNEAWFAVAIY